MCILLLFCGVYILTRSNTLCCSSLLYPYWLSLALSITVRGVLKSPTVIVELSGNFCFLYFEPLWLSTNTFKIVTLGHYILIVGEVGIFIMTSRVKFMFLTLKNLWKNLWKNITQPNSSAFCLWYRICHFLKNILKPINNFLINFSSHFFAFKVF